MEPWDMAAFRTREEEKNSHRRLRREGEPGRWCDRNQVRTEFKE